MGLIDMALDGVWFVLRLAMHGTFRFAFVATVDLDIETWCECLAG